MLFKKWQFCKYNGNVIVQMSYCQRSSYLIEYKCF